MNQNNNIIIAFTEEANSALFDIEKRYNIEEKDEEWIKKLNEKKQFNRNIIVNLIREFVKNNIQQKEFIGSLEKDLNMNNETAENIFKDIATDIMPFIIKTSEEEIKKGVFRDIDNNDKKIQPIILKPTKIIREEKTINNTYDSDRIKIQENIKEIKSPTVKTNIIDEKIDKKSTIRKKIEETKKPIKRDDVKKQTDSYREPIE